MADRPGDNKKDKRKLKQLVAGLGLGGEYTFVIEKAIQEGWTQTHFLTALVHSRPFHRQFPGLIQHGGIAPFLSANPSQFSASNLGTAIGQWYQLKNAYTQALRGYDQNLTNQGFAALIKGQVSPDEFASRVNVIQTVNQNPGLRDIFNQELKAYGKPNLDELGFLKFIGKTAPKDFYDIYEAAQLRQAGLNFTAEGALSTAQQLGQPGQAADVGSIIQQIRALKPDIGPELDRRGITDADLVLLEGGTDTKGIEPILRQLIAQRRASGSFVPGTQAQRGAGGGLTLLPQEEAAAY